MNNVDIRKVVPADIERLVTIGQKTFLDTYGALNTEENMRAYLESHFSKQRLKSELNNANIAYYFAVIEGVVIGYLKLNFGEAQTELKGEHSLEIERIYVLKEYQGKKLGQRFCRHAVEVAQQRQLDFVWLGVWEQNTKAIEFYEKNEFVAFDQHVFVLGDEEQTDLMMKFEVVS